MTEEERQLLLELTGTMQLLLEKLGMLQTTHDFECVVMPLQAKVFEAQRLTGYCPACGTAGHRHAASCVLQR